MKIAIDARLLEDKRRTGTGEYLYNLIKYLLFQDYVNQYYLIVNRYNMFQSKTETIKVNMGINNKFNQIWEQLFLPSVLKKFDIDVFHGPDFRVPLQKTKYARIVTIHDLAMFKFPEYYKTTTKLWFGYIIKKSIINADYIAAVSESTKRDIMELFNINASKIYVTPLGVDIEEWDGFSDININIEVGNDYILAVGTIQPRKNYKRLILAYNKLRDRYNGKILLVIVGKCGWLFKDVLDEAKNSEYNEDIKILHYVSRKELIGLYRRAKIFAFPSLYEGFGLPLLEAMYFGIPIAVSRNSSLAEVVGDAGIYFNQYDIEDISDSMHKILTNEEVRSALIQKGLKRIGKYSWATTAKKTLSIYNMANQ